MSDLLGGVTRYLIWPNVVKHVVDLQALPVIIGANPERARHVKPARTVVGGEIVVQRTAVLVHELRAVLEAQTLALCLFQRDANNGLHRGGIAGTRVLNHIDMLDLIGAQTGEFLHVLYPSPVDIHFGFTTAQNLHATVALSFERRNLRQGITHGSGLLQYCTSDGGTHGVALHTCLRQASLYNHATQFMSLVEPHRCVCQQTIILLSRCHHCHHHCSHQCCES